MVQLKNGTFVEDRRLDRIPQLDPRSRNFPIRTMVPRKPRSYTWRCDTYLDQGQEGACVGFSFAHDLAARPKVHQTTDEFARMIYRRAQELDQWPGGEPDYSGTSVIAGAKSVQERGLIGEYRWAFGLDDVVATLGFSPIVFGLNWYEGMFNTDQNGYLNVTGRLAGGHAILGKGISLKGQYVLLHNSWGQDWGQKATAKISFSDLDRLLREDGEACVPLARK